MAFSKKTLQKIDEDAEEFAREFMDFAGTDALDDLLDRMREVLYKEGSFK